MPRKELVHVHIPRPTTRLKESEEAIRDRVKQGIAQVTGIIPLPPTNLSFFDDINRATYVGIGWRNTRQGEITILVHPPLSELALDEVLPSLIARALYVEVRRESVGYGENLYADVITEGLASSFLRELGETTMFPWDIALPSSGTPEEWVKKIYIQSLKKTQYVHERWFYGAKPEKVPLWTGFAIGYLLIQQYLKVHPQDRPSTVLEKDLASMTP